MNKSYDFHGAESLIPLLRVIQREIGERKRAIHHMAIEIQTLSEDTNRSEKDRRIAVGHLLAAVSTHKRELRLSERELEKLGCATDSLDPRTVHIPGEDGSHDSGFIWRVGQTEIRELQAD